MKAVMCDGALERIQSFEQDMEDESENEIVFNALLIQLCH
jgi:hypothetical protein